MKISEQVTKYLNEDKEDDARVEEIWKTMWDKKDVSIDIFEVNGVFGGDRSLLGNLGGGIFRTYGREVVGII
jgi:hypothetical protein